MNLKRWFGHKTLLFDARLYHVLTDGQTNRRMYFDEFREKFYKPMFEDVPLARANLMFKMLDFDGDGFLHASDLVEAATYCDELSTFGEELSKLSDYYIKVYLESRVRIKIADQINIFRYKEILDDSGPPVSG